MKLRFLKIRLITWTIILSTLLLFVMLNSLSLASASDLTLVSNQALSSRLYELTFSTQALSTQTKVRVLLPANYSSNPTLRYPVLYLLHGCCNPGDSTKASTGYLNWTVAMNAEQNTASYNMIIVMPDGGQGGFYSDWYNNGSYGQPKWETYHINQLIPWIDANYRTIANRNKRAIGGLSMGGFGAISYAERHPDLFCATAAFSGYVDNMANPDLASNVCVYDGGGPTSIWGTRAYDEVRWRGHNPPDLAENLKGMTIVLRTGNGYDSSGILIDPTEQECEQANIKLHNALQSLGYSHTWDDYGPGTHSPSYWERALIQTLPIWSQVFSQNVQPPTTFAYNAIEPTYTVFNWNVQTTRNVLEFSRLAVTSTGFTLKGSGTAVVKTAPIYVAGARYTVKISGPNQNVTQTLTAGTDKRLTVSLTLGPSNRYQQYTAETVYFPSVFYTNTVTITKIL